MRSRQLSAIANVDDGVSSLCLPETQMLTSKARRRPRHAYDQITSLALSRLNYYYQQFVHDYHHIVDDDSLNGSRTRNQAAPVVISPKGHTFALTPRFKNHPLESARDPVDSSRYFNLARRFDSLSARIAPRRAPVQYVSVKLEPGPGAYTPRFQFFHGSPGNVIDMDQIPGREPVMSRKDRSDLGPGTYDIPPLPKASSYTPRFDRTTTREQYSFFSDDTPGPGTYSPKIILKNVQAPKYLTMSPRKLIVSDKIDPDTPGPGAYNQEPGRIFNDRGFTFPVDDRRLEYPYLHQDGTDEAKRVRKNKEKVVSNFPGKDFIASNLIVPSRQQKTKIAEQRLAQRKQRYEITMERCRYYQNVSARIAEREENRTNRKLFRKHWSVILIQGTFCTRMKKLLLEHRKSAEINQGILIRRTRLIMTLRKYAHAFKHHLQLKRRQRGIALIKKFFAETEILARSYATCIIRNFRKAVAVLQRFWLNQLVKMEHQIFAMLVQWNCYESNNKARSKFPDRGGQDNLLSTSLAATQTFRGSLIRRITARILSLDDDVNNSLITLSRRQHQYQTKIAVLRGFLIQKRHDHWGNSCAWKIQRQQWFLEKRSKDSTMDNARKIIQGESGVDNSEIEKEFKLAFPCPFFSLALSNAELAGLIRLSHVEYRKTNIREKRRVRVRSPTHMSMTSAFSVNTHG